MSNQILDGYVGYAAAAETMMKKLEDENVVLKAQLKNAIKERGVLKTENAELQAKLDKDQAK